MSLIKDLRVPIVKVEFTFYKHDEKHVLRIISLISKAQKNKKKIPSALIQKLINFIDQSQPITTYEDIDYIELVNRCKKVKKVFKKKYDFDIIISKNKTPVKKGMIYFGKGFSIASYNLDELITKSAKKTLDDVITEGYENNKPKIVKIAHKHISDYLSQPDIVNHKEVKKFKHYQKAALAGCIAENLGAVVKKITDPDTVNSYWEAVKNQFKKKN